VSFRLIDAEQRSPEWFAARLGCITASRAGDILAAIKSGEAAARRDYRVELTLQRITGQPTDDGYTNSDMQRGTDLEPEAFAAYEMHTGRMARKVGFLRHTELMAGASPDGVIGDFDGLLELKCPKSATHLKYLRAGGVPSDYLPQLTHQLWISQAPWVDFVSYDPRFPEHMQLFLARLHAKDADIALYERKALAFLEEVDAEVRALQTMSNLSQQLRAAVA
jgi:putative phage-type endonuclease